MATFKLTDDHLKLLREAYLDWSDVEYGAPSIDPKRPYGNSFVERDVAEILEWPIGPDGLTDEQHYRAAQIHRETLYALEILIRHGTVKLGEYAGRDGGWCRIC